MLIRSLRFLALSCGLAVLSTMIGPVNSIVNATNDCTYHVDYDMYQYPSTYVTTIAGGSCFGCNTSSAQACHDLATNDGNSNADSACDAMGWETPGSGYVAISTPYWFNSVYQDEIHNQYDCGDV